MGYNPTRPFQKAARRFLVYREAMGGAIAPSEAELNRLERNRLRFEINPLLVANIDNSLINSHIITQTFPTKPLKHRSVVSGRRNLSVSLHEVKS